MQLRNRALTCRICDETTAHLMALRCSSCGEAQADACGPCAVAWARSPLCGDCDYRARRAAVCAAFYCPHGYGECEDARACVYPGRCGTATCTSMEAQHAG